MSSDTQIEQALVAVVSAARRVADLEEVAGQISMMPDTDDTDTNRGIALVQKRLMLERDAGHELMAQGCAVIGRAIGANDADAEG